MKHVMLSADSSPSIYSVPDIVADNIYEYCMEFCNKWLPESPDAAELDHAGHEDYIMVKELCEGNRA